MSAWPIVLRSNHILQTVSITPGMSKVLVATHDSRGEITRVTLTREECADIILALTDAAKELRV